MEIIDDDDDDVCDDGHHSDDGDDTESDSDPQDCKTWTNYPFPKMIMMISVKMEIRLMMVMRSVMMVIIMMMKMIMIQRTAKHGSTTLSNLMLKITASQELNGTQVLQINTLFTSLALCLAFWPWHIFSDSRKISFFD